MSDITYTCKLDRGDMKILRRLIKEIREGKASTADATFLEYMLDRAEGITKPEGIKISVSDDNSVSLSFVGERTYDTQIPN